MEPDALVNQDVIDTLLNTLVWQASDLDGNPLDKLGYTAKDISPNGAAEVILGYRQFCQMYGDAITGFLTTPHGQASDITPLSPTDVAYFYIVTRNGHGSGFGVDYPDDLNAQFLARVCRNAGPLDLMQADDGTLDVIGYPTFGTWIPGRADDGLQRIQYVDVVTIQGDEAYPYLDQINGKAGANKVLEELSGWDFGDETTNAAWLTHLGDLTKPPYGDTDHLFFGRVPGGASYVLSWDVNSSLYVSLARTELAPAPATPSPSPAASIVAAANAQPTMQAATTPSVNPAAPVAAPTIAQTPGLGL